METNLLQRLLGEADSYAYEEAFLYNQSLTGYQLFDPAEQEAEEEVYLEAFNTKLIELGKEYNLDVTPYLKKEV